MVGGSCSPWQVHSSGRLISSPSPRRSSHWYQRILAHLPRTDVSSSGRNVLPQGLCRQRRHRSSRLTPEEARYVPVQLRAKSTWELDGGMSMKMRSQAVETYANASILEPHANRSRHAHFWTALPDRNSSTWGGMDLLPHNLRHWIHT